MRPRMPLLNALRAFEAAGRHKKLSDAAVEMSVNIGAVSRHVSLLEEYVGCQLFERHRHGLKLTERGKHYLPEITQALDQIDAATAELVGGPQQSRLSVKVVTTLAVEWLVPRLPRFLVEHPGIDFRLATTIYRTNFDTDDVDLSLYREPMTSSGLEFTPLFYPEYVPVCSPELLKRGSPPKEPNDRPPLGGPG